MNDLLFFLLPPWVDPLYGIWLPLAAFVFALLAQSRVTSTFRRFARVPTRAGLSGRDVAELLLRSRGLADVRIEETSGFLRDHYDPRDKTLRLSREVFHGRSVAALGVAAHETGHALQHADAYAWLQFRSSVVPVVSIASRIGGWLLPIGMALAYLSGGHAGTTLLVIAAIGLAMTVLFSLVTLPVEIDASKRALQLLGGSGVLVGSELDGARSVLSAAAWTYVATAAAAIVELLRVLAILAGNRSRQSSN